MAQAVELSSGQVEYEEHGRPDGAPIVFIHGLLVDGSLWSRVVPELERFRCIVPTLPLGAHRMPLRDARAATPTGVADLIAELLERLDLQDATLVGNDTGGAITQLLLVRSPERVGRVVLTNCDAFENFLPPAFRPLQWLAKARLLGLVLQGLRIRGLRDSPLGFGLLHSEPLEAELLERWSRPSLEDRRVRRDAVRFTSAIDNRLTLDAADRLKDFRRPVLLAWGDADRFFRISFAERLAAVLPDAELVPVAGARTFVPLDRPAELARLIAQFAGRPLPASPAVGSAA